MDKNNTELPGSVVDDIVKATGASSVRIANSLQELWSGYGRIVQLQLSGISIDTAILKLIEPPSTAQHPREWNTTESHQRKIRSYEVETHWYQRFASQCGADCKVPIVIDAGSSASRQWILMEDLTTAYPRRSANLNVAQAQVCLTWLAAFHARFLKCDPIGLWPIGTYWHLNTRHKELESMPDGVLKARASELDRRLNECQYQCIVHGDAKVANFCFSQDMNSVAAVDFQYVGGGVGIKDVAYFLGSCLDETTIEQYESVLLSSYFSALHEAISTKHSLEMANRVEQEWSGLYAIAWTDFYRFLEGWMPGHNKINNYTKQLALRAFEQLAENY